MIHNAMVAAPQTCAIHCFPCKVADTEPHETNDDIMRSKRARGIIRQANAVSGRCLAGDRAIGFCDRAGPFQADDPGNTKDDCAGTFRFHPRAKTSWYHSFALRWVVVFEIRDLDHPASTAA